MAQSPTHLPHRGTLRRRCHRDDQPPWQRRHGFEPVGWGRLRQWRGGRKAAAMMDRLVRTVWFRILSNSWVKKPGALSSFPGIRPNHDARGRQIRGGSAAQPLAPGALGRRGGDGGAAQLVVWLLNDLLLTAGLSGGRTSRLIRAGEEGQRLGESQLAVGGLTSALRAGSLKDRRPVERCWPPRRMQ